MKGQLIFVWMAVVLLATSSPSDAAFLKTKALVLGSWPISKLAHLWGSSHAVQPLPVAPAVTYGVPVHYVPPPPTQKPVPVQIVVPEEEPLLNTADLLAVWEAVKQKTVYQNPIINHFRRKPVAAPVVQVPVPSYKFVPSLGFSHYNNIKYYPVVPVHASKVVHEQHKPVPEAVHHHDSHLDISSGEFHDISFQKEIKGVSEFSSGVSKPGPYP